jgi:hypothetical protein
MPRETPGRWREKQKIEPDKEKIKVLYCFQIKIICSSLGESEL